MFWSVGWKAGRHWVLDRNSVHGIISQLCPPSREMYAPLMSQLSIISLGLTGLMAGENMPPLPVNPSGVHLAPPAWADEHKHKQIPIIDAADPAVFISDILHQLGQ
jgi:hypothetical protein